MGSMHSRLVSYGLRAAIGTTLACLVACGMSSAESLSADRTGPNAGADGGVNASESPTGGSDASPGAPTGSGVVLVHAASFPAFRLCFEKNLSQKPQPDSKLMVEANVVGVDDGTAIRIQGIDAPGKIYVIDESTIRNRLGEAEPTCAELICKDGQSCLRYGSDYFETQPITKALGKDGVDLLAIAGCGSKSLVLNGGGNVADCEGQAVPFDESYGNLQATPIRLSPQSVATDISLPIQIVHLSPALEKKRAAGLLEISFGKLTAAVAPETVASNPKLFAASTQQTLKVDQKLESFYGESGFRIVTRPSPGAQPTFEIDQTLAQIQELSSPSDVPNSYYKVASNYALLILGNPNIPRTLQDAAPDPNYKARKGVHVLAVPILEPNPDAGAPDAQAGDGGDGGSL